MRGLGTPLWVQFRQFSDDPAEIEAMVATYREYNLAHHDEMVRPYQGVVEAVRSLHRGANVLGLVTSKMRSGAVRGLRIAGLEDAFDVIVGSDEVTHPKPHPEPVLIALERLGAPPESAVFIGDSRHDLECGRAVLVCRFHDRAARARRSSRAGRVAVPDPRSIAVGVEHLAVGHGPQRPPAGQADR